MLQTFPCSFLLIAPHGVGSTSFQEALKHMGLYAVNFGSVFANFNFTEFAKKYKKLGIYLHDTRSNMPVAGQLEGNIPILLLQRDPVALMKSIVNHYLKMQTLRFSDELTFVYSNIDTMIEMRLNEEPSGMKDVYTYAHSFHLIKNIHSVEAISTDDIWPETIENTLKKIIDFFQVDYDHSALEKCKHMSYASNVFFYSEQHFFIANNNLKYYFIPESILHQHIKPSKRIHFIEKAQYKGETYCLMQQGGEQAQCPFNTKVLQKNLELCIDIVQKKIEIHDRHTITSQDIMDTLQNNADLRNAFLRFYKEDAEILQRYSPQHYEKWTLFRELRENKACTPVLENLVSLTNSE